MFQSDTEIEADGFGVSDMKATVWFRWKAGMHSILVFIRLQVFRNNLSDKVRGSSFSHIKSMYRNFEKVSQDGLTCDSLF
jgi:hypothetical protein